MARDERKRRGDWNDFFEEFDQEFSEMRDRFDQIMEGFVNGELDAESRPLIYGFSMRVGGDGVPVIQEFGNTTGATQTGEKDLLREPLTDIIESDDKVRVIVELPGVEKNDIRLNADGRTLEIEVENPDKRFSKHLDLPCDVRPGSAKANYKNGVLEVVLTRRAPKRKGKAIPVD
ncbi:MAG: Hsp20/alpha crystallin family protein [Methanomassiliicoccales archaeon]|nr:Hsp20/alpha crystallin family protein [Methanomassiliicoccales archaeon]